MSLVYKFWCMFVLDRCIHGYFRCMGSIQWRIWIFPTEFTMLTFSHLVSSVIHGICSTYPSLNLSHSYDFPRSDLWISYLSRSWSDFHKIVERPYCKISSHSVQRNSRVRSYVFLFVTICLRINSDLIKNWSRFFVTLFHRRSWSLSFQMIE